MNSYHARQKMIVQCPWRSDDGHCDESGGDLTCLMDGDDVSSGQRFAGRSTWVAPVSLDSA